MDMYELTDEQTSIVDACHAGGPVVIQAGAGTGKTSTLRAAAQRMPGRGLYMAFNKALRNDQPVLTLDGWRPIGDLRVGDLVIGKDGGAHRVTKVHPRGVRPMFEVVFSDGTVVVADEDHLWLTQTITYDARRLTRQQKASGGQWRVRTTSQLAKTVHQKHRVPHLDGPVELPHRDLPCSPYLLGALIGDGSFKRHCVYFACAEPELVTLVRAELPSDHVLNPVSDSGRGRSWVISGQRKGVRGSNDVMATLRDLGLQGHGSDTKFVPESYMLGDTGQRLALLQGLMDTDGCATGARALFTTTSKVLAEQVVQLCQSLAGVGTIYTSKGAYWVNVRIDPSLCPFRMPRKVAAWRPRRRNEQTPRKVTAVRPAAPAEATCISIDAADHLFVTAGCVLTHNSVQTEAAGSFPRHVAARTAHSLAYREAGVRIAHRLRGPRQPAREAARLLGIREAIKVGDSTLFQPAQVARLALGMVTVFCQSADDEPTTQHLAKVTGIDGPDHDDLAAQLLPHAVRAWADLTTRDGDLRPSHDHYLKRWALTRPTLPYDFIMLDEAQDTNPVVEQVFTAQSGHAQLVMVGDACQAIYGWRGARDIMSGAAGQHLVLSQSWRFGPRVADEANLWLEELQAALRLTGAPGAESRVAALPDRTWPDAVLCRTNAGAVRQCMDALDAGKRVALVGGTRQIVALAEAAKDLKAGRGTAHPDLFAFTTWAQVQDYVEHDDAGGLAVFVRLVDQHGPDTIIRALAAVGDDDGHADVVVSTAHKAKGREWPVVRVADDFKGPVDDDGAARDIPRPDAMLAYVTVTRARRHLDPGSLAWTKPKVQA